MEPSDPTPAGPDPYSSVDLSAASAIAPEDLPPLLPVTVTELNSPATRAAPPPPSSAPFIFHGEAGEYFRIWIVNTLLSVVTCGIFSAWAKVRKRRYLRGNTELLGHRFDYTAQPRRILVGNLIVAALFLAFSLFGAVYPAVRLIALGIAVALLPWIIVRSLAFNAHHTVWRGLRFRFHPSLSAAVLVYLLQSLLVPVTLGFYYPAWVRARAEFRISRHRFGTAYFRFDAKKRPFYRAYLIAGGIFLATITALGFAVTFITEANGGRTPTTSQLLPVMFGYVATLYVLKHYLFASLFNPIWNGTSLGENRFRATLRTRRWLAIQVTNVLAIAVSGGLLYPWATIRTTRYALSCLQFLPAGPIDWIARVGSTPGSAVGDTAAEFAGMDFGL